MRLEFRSQRRPDLQTAPASSPRIRMRSVLATPASPSISHSTGQLPGPRSTQAKPRPIPLTHACDDIGPHPRPKLRPPVRPDHRLSLSHPSPCPPPADLRSRSARVVPAYGHRPLPCPVPGLLLQPTPRCVCTRVQTRSHPRLARATPTSSQTSSLSLRLTLLSRLSTTPRPTGHPTPQVSFDPSF